MLILKSVFHYSSSGTVHIQKHNYFFKKLKRHTNIISRMCCDIVVQTPKLSPTQFLLQTTKKRNHNKTM